MTASFPPEVRSFLARVAKVETGKGPREHHVLDRVVEALVIARRAGDPAIERESNLVGAEEGAERVCHGAAVECVRRRILRMVRRRAQRCPGWIGLGIRVAVLGCPLDGLVGTPRQIVILGFEARDHSVAPGHMRHRQHPRCVYKVESAVVDEAKHAVAPLPKIVVGPEKRLGCLRWSANHTVDTAQFLNLVEILGVLLAGQLIWTVRAELRRALERERRHSRQEKTDDWTRGSGGATL